MNKLDLLRLSLGNLWRRKVRTFLTVLGVVIGTSSIVVMVSLGLAMDAGFQEQIQNMGDLTVIEVNEGGGRHIVQAMGRPSLVVCSPMASKKTWLPENDEVLTRGIAATDINPQAGSLSYQEQYGLISVERVWTALQTFYSRITH